MAALVALAADARSRTKVVLTFRADYFNHPLDHPEFAKLITSGLVTVAVPDEAELAEAVTLPAEAAGLELEPGLVATVVTDVSGQPTRRSSSHAVHPHRAGSPPRWPPTHHVGLP